MKYFTNKETKIIIVSIDQLAPIADCVLADFNDIEKAIVAFKNTKLEDRMGKNYEVEIKSEQLNESMA